ncbi:MAG: hypothetical protein NTV49_08190 [Kiritimatiellaeota bacterium]|nr:hypothetical protein [Kiritimatiellota bacterium]
MMRMLQGGLGLALAWGVVLPARADRVAVQSTSDAAAIANGKLRVTFDTTRGTWSAESLVDKTELFAGAANRINNWSSGAAGATHKIESSRVNDKLGKGRTMTVRSLCPGQPELMLSITLYEDGKAIVLGCGVKNTLQNEFRVMSFDPLCGAQLFPGIAEMKEAQTLDGIAGAGGNTVTQGSTRDSPNNLLLTFMDKNQRRSVVAGGLTYHDFGKWASVFTGATGRPSLSVNAKDPVGRLVNPGEAYTPDDYFYADMVTPDPFTALEDYGRAVRARQNAKPNIYDFPTVCAWYVQEFTHSARINHSAGLVGEMDEVAKTGFLKYATVALRLVPDKYHDDSEQGWWDDEHWQKFGHYTKPYETSQKWCQAVRARGGLPFTYFQTGLPSDDYAKAFPGHMLSNDISQITRPHSHHLPHVSFDYTDPGFQAHLQKVWGDLGKAGMAGVMFDYPETGWRIDGGFEDQQSSTAAAYRKIFELIRAGLGPTGYIHERNLGEPGKEGNPGAPLLDVTAGLVDSQRVWGDSCDFCPEMVKRCGLRWYKTRTIYTYDMDSKTLLLKNLGAADRPDLRRQSILTMLYVTAGRVLLADSFRTLTPEMLHELSRIFPIHREPQSARPVDAFTPEGRNCPRVFDFAVSPDWHQVTFFNPDFGNKTRITVALSGEAATPALGLAANAEYYAYDFWNNRFIGRRKGSEKLEQELLPSEARMIALHRVEPNPQFIATDRHIMQGYLDLLEQPRWNKAAKILAGTSKVIGGESYQVVVACNGFKPVSASAGGAAATMEPLAGADDLAVLSMASKNHADVKWAIHFK